MKLVFAILSACLPTIVLAQQLDKKTPRADAAIARGLDILARDAVAWKKKHNCVLCHHAGLIIWLMRAAPRGR
jgi:hypothetical protein